MFKFFFWFSSEIMIWSFISLSTLFKPYRDDGRVIMKGSVQWSTIQKWISSENRVHIFMLIVALCKALFSGKKTHLLFAETAFSIQKVKNPRQICASLIQVSCISCSNLGVSRLLRGKHSDLMGVQDGKGLCCLYLYLGLKPPYCFIRWVKKKSKKKKRNKKHTYFIYLENWDTFSLLFLKF